MAGENENPEGGTPGGEVTRPEWAPETVWDDTAKSWNNDALKGQFEELGTLRTFKTEADTAAAAIPKDAAGYKITLPEKFEIPKGLEFKVDEKDPNVANLRAFAVANKLPQETVTGLVGVYAGMLLEGLKADGEFLAKEKTALGAKADDRIDAARMWAEGTLGKDKAGALAPLLETKAGVEALEAIIEKMAGVKMAGNSDTRIEEVKNPLAARFPTMAPARN